jgi:hypothetical protein
MSRLYLRPHPDHPSASVRDVSAELRGEGGRLSLVYRIEGAERVAWPAPSRPVRADELWRATCFELFLQFDDGERYVEFNFSPSTCWAAYAFDGYREGMAELPLRVSPRIALLPDGIAVSCDLTGLPHGELAMGLSAVVEEEGGVKSYWALAHAPGPPDFHNPACFMARLPAPRAP